MRVITWNMKWATKTSAAWKILTNFNPDIVLLQEVGSIPAEIKKGFDILSKVAVKKTGTPQKFSTVVLVKGRIIKEIPLKSEYGWVNKELEFFKGNFISCVVRLQNQEQINVVSVYSPAWPINKARLKGIDVSPVKLKLNANVWGSEIIWSALKNFMSNNETWIVGGDYNSSETFDGVYQVEHGITTGLISDGNKEIRDRMHALGFKECLREHNGKLIPTFKNPKEGKVIHQIDHLYVTDNLYSQIESCKVGNQSVIFGNSLSDHLPIIADFKDMQSIQSYKGNFNV